MKLTLRPYQETIVNDLRRAYREGSRAVLLTSPCGSGKTVMFAHITEGAAARGNRVMILVHRQELLSQCSGALTELGVPHGMIAPNRTATYDLVQVASVQTLVRRLNRTPAPNLIIVDECFPSGTMVSGMPIEQYRPGDVVQAFNHSTDQIVQSRIKRVFKKTPSSLCRIKFMDGKIIVCTPSHPFYSPQIKAYIPAIHLKKWTAVYENPSKNHVQNMRETICGDMQKSDLFAGMPTCREGGDQVASGDHEVPRMRERSDMCWTRWASLCQKRACILFSGMFKTIFGGKQQQGHGGYKQKICIGQNEEKQSDDETGDQKTCIRDTQGNGLGAGGEARKWIHHEATGYTGKSSRMAKGGCNPHNESTRHGLSDVLQGGRGQQGLDDRGGDKREISLPNNTKAAGREEKGILGINWVESVDILERGSDGTFGGMCPDGFVYNLEVERHHNYFANGVLVHNCHHTNAGSWRRIIEHYRKALILGVTATPVRLDGQGLGVESGGYFDRLVLGPSVRELIDQGYLTRPVVYAPPVGADMAGVHRRFGDFVAKETAERMDKPHITGNAVEHYLRICPNAPAIAFCVSVQHAEHMAERFRAADVPSESLDGTMDDRMRRHRIMALADGRIRVLTSCDIVSEGTDIPVVTAAILLRPTQSTGLYIQQTGRCLRPFPGKTHSIILDHVGNVFRHGFPDMDRVWTLDGEDVEKRPAVQGETVSANVQCERCYLVFPAWLKQCPSCGWIRENGREIREVDGELEKLEAQREQERFDKKRAISAARTLDELIAVGKRLGYKSGWANYVWRARCARQGKKTAS